MSRATKVMRRSLCLIVVAIFLGAAGGPDSPGAEAAVNTYARISADIPACRLRPQSWGKRLRAKVSEVIQHDRPDLADEFAQTAKDALSYPDLNACRAPDVEKSLRYGDGVLNGRRSVWAVFD